MTNIFLTVPLPFRENWVNIQQSGWRYNIQTKVTPPNGNQPEM
jgi:hypothetical protein